MRLTSKTPRGGQGGRTSLKRTKRCEPTCSGSISLSLSLAYASTSSTLSSIEDGSRDSASAVSADSASPSVSMSALSRAEAGSSLETDLAKAAISSARLASFARRLVVDSEIAFAEETGMRCSPYRSMNWQVSQHSPAMWPRELGSTHLGSELANQVCTMQMNKGVANKGRHVLDTGRVGPVRVMDRSERDALTLFGSASVSNTGNLWGADIPCTAEQSTAYESHRANG